MRPPKSVARRRWAGLLAGAALAAALPAALSGCGFTLKRPPELQLRRVQLRGFAPHAPMADELRRQLRASPGVTVAEAARDADLVLEALDVADERLVAATTAAAQVRELTLRTRLRFRVYTPAGRELINPTELALSRDISYNETAALAKDYEITLMQREMQRDIASQVLRRLAALTPEMAFAPLPAASAASAAEPEPTFSPPISDPPPAAARPAASGSLPAGW